MKSFPFAVMLTICGCSYASDDLPNLSFWEQSHMTGDWGGLRPQLKELGLSFELEYTQFYQGMLSGNGNKNFEPAGRLDAFFNVDTSKLGLWEGGGLRTHVEYRYSKLPSSYGGALLPTNAGNFLAVGAKDDVVASSIYLTQKIGNSTNVMLGKINAVDLAANNAFFGGWGTKRFANIAFVAPPSGVMAPVIYGVIANIKTMPVIWTIIVADPHDRTSDYWPDDLFADGEIYSLTATYVGKLGGRTTTYSLGGTYNTKDSVDLEELPATGLKTGSYSVSLSFSHFIKESTDNPGNGWGLFVKGSLADGNPNMIQGSIIAGLGGKGLIPSRKDDNFGLGYFYYNVSDVFQTAIAPFKKITDERGLEIFYDIAIAPWLHVTADVQVIDTTSGNKDTAIIGGLRTNIIF